MKDNNQERNNIIKFVQSIGEKNYAKANESLKKTIENKILNRIRQQKNINIFTNER